MRDFYTDPGHGTLRKLLQRMPKFAEWLGNPDIPTEAEALPPRAFAWQGMRLFPVHSREQAAISYAYSKVASEQLPTFVQRELDTALDAFGIPKEIFELAATKTAAIRDEDYLFPEEPAYPVRNPEEVKFAEQRLLEQCAVLTKRAGFRGRTTIFEKLADAADRHHVLLQPMSYCYAQRTYPSDPLSLSIGLRYRAKLASSPDAKALYDDLAKVTLAQYDQLRDPALLRKLVNKVAELDEVALPKDASVVDPVLLAYGSMRHTKQAMQTVDIGDSEPWTAEGLAQLGPNFFASALGPDIVPNIIDPKVPSRVDPTRLHDILNTLPADMKSSFAVHARGALGQAV